MSLASFIDAMPKVELHVHLEGSIQPATLLKLAAEHKIALPAQNLAGVQEWYRFRDFPHFIEIYLLISSCIQSVEDLEFIAREFLSQQAAQNIRYTEVTYTAFTHYTFKGLAFADQLAALNRARAWASQEFGCTMGLVIDIPRSIAAEAGLRVADWAISAMGDGVVALGLGGPEVGNPPEKFAAAFQRARAAGLPRVPHAGETVGPESIWGALRVLDAQRIGHGVRCLEDPALVKELLERQIPLEVCPTSNVCLGVVPSLAEHPLPRLLTEGLYVTLNSDDPPMFNTTLTNEFQVTAQTFGLPGDRLEQLTLNALGASFIEPAAKSALELDFSREFAQLRQAHLAAEGTWDNDE